MMFSKGDIVRKNFPLIEQVFIVEDVRKNKVKIDSRWQSDEDYRLMGSLSFYKKRVKEQYLFLESAKAKDYYSPSRKLQVLISIHYTINRLEQLVWKAEDILCITNSPKGLGLKKVFSDRFVLIKGYVSTILILFE